MRERLRGCPGDTARVRDSRGVDREGHNGTRREEWGIGATYRDGGGRTHLIGGAIYSTEGCKRRLGGKARVYKREEEEEQERKGELSLLCSRNSTASIHAKE